MLTRLQKLPCHPPHRGEDHLAATGGRKPVLDAGPHKQIRKERNVGRPTGDDRSLDVKLVLPHDKRAAETTEQGRRKPNVLASRRRAGADCRGTRDGPYR